MINVILAWPLVVAAFGGGHLFVHKHSDLPNHFKNNIAKIPLTATSTPTTPPPQATRPIKAPVASPTKKTPKIDAPAALTSDPKLGPVARAELTLTADAVAESAPGELHITNPTVRAVVDGGNKQHIKAQFTYLGPTAKTVPLADGEIRRQFAFKLLAHDLCNYWVVSWQFSPNQRLQILKKENPGKTDFEDCGADGYSVVKAKTSAKPPVVVVGSTHTLEAEVTPKNELVVTIDDGIVWQGDIESEITYLGPVGLRTDNAAFIARLFTEQ